MTWNPVAARKRLEASSLACFKGELEKLSAWMMPSGRELALSEENKRKVTIYLSRAPRHLPGVAVEHTYLPSLVNAGRHSNLQLITDTLGCTHKAHRLSVESLEAFERLLLWYQYA